VFNEGTNGRLSIKTSCCNIAKLIYNMHMRVFKAGYAPEPDIKSPEHSANRDARTAALFLGRIILISSGIGFEDAIAETAKAFPPNVETVHVRGLMPAFALGSFSCADRDMVTEVADGLARRRHADGYKRVINMGITDLNGSVDYTFCDHINDQTMQIWGAPDARNDWTYGLVYPITDDTLAEICSLQPGSVAQVQRLSGVGVQIADAQVNLQWQKLYPRAA
jgi:hypothetical protein